LGTGGGGAAQVNFRSQVHQYDALQRLIKSEMGNAAPLTGEPTEIVSSQPFRKDQWRLDHLGNWIGGKAGAPTGRSAIGDLDNGSSGSFALAGVYRTCTGNYARWEPTAGSVDVGADTHAQRHAINQQNEIQSLQRVRDGVASTTAFAYDASGNLIDDGVYR
jgi:hypothetical protein